MKYIVEGIFLLETEAEGERDAQYKAKGKLASKGARIYVMGACKKEDEQHED